MYKGGDPITPKAAPRPTPKPVVIPPAVAQAVAHAVQSVGHTAQAVQQSPIVHEAPAPAQSSGPAGGFHKLAAALVQASEQTPEPRHEGITESGSTAGMLIRNLASQLLALSPRLYDVPPAPTQTYRYSPQGGMALPPTGPDRLPMRPGIKSQAGGPTYTQNIPNATVAPDRATARELQRLLGIRSSPAMPKAERLV